MKTKAHMMESVDIEDLKSSEGYLRESSSLSMSSTSSDDELIVNREADICMNDISRDASQRLFIRDSVAFRGRFWVSDKPEVSQLKSLFY